MQAELAIEKIEMKPLFKRIPFLVLIISGLLANISFSMFIFSQSWFVLKELNFAAGLGYIFIASSVPRIIFMVFGGVIADKIKKTRIIFCCMMIEVILVLSIMFTLKSGVETIWVFVAAAFCFGTSDALQIPARTSLLPMLVDKSQLTRANSLYSLIGTSAAVAGAFLAGISIGKLGFYSTFTIIGCATFVAAMMTFLIRYQHTPLKNGEGKEEKFFQSMKNGFLYVKNSKFLIALFGLAVALNFFIAGPLTMGIPIIADKVFNGDAIVFSMMESSFLIGMVIGSVLIGILNIRKNKGKVSIIAITFAGLFMFCIGLVDVLWMTLGLMGIVGLLLAFTNTPLITMLQSNTDENMLGRVMSILMICAMGLTPVSYALTSLLLQMGLHIQFILCLATVPVIAVGLYTYFFVPVLKNAD